MVLFSLSRFHGVTTQMADIENLGEIRMLIGELKKEMSCLSVSLPNISLKGHLKLFHTPFNLYLGQFLLVSFCTYTYSVVCHTQKTHSPSLKKLPTFSHQMMSQEEK